MEIENKVFLGLGIITIISGLILTFSMRLYVPGICGTIVGVWLTWDNWKKIKR